MNIVEEYARQFKWRSWGEVFDALPIVDGHAVLDLGCGIGDQAAELSKRGCRVVGIDGNCELINFAISRNIRNARFEVDNIAALDKVAELFDGVWASFSPAYFPNNFSQTLECWRRKLRKGGWIALTEVDDMFGHHPVSSRTETLLDEYAEDALSQSRYDFRMGHKLARYLARAEFTVKKSFDIYDAELAFEGCASTEVKEAWQKRFEHMDLLRKFCSTEFQQVVSDFVSGISRDDHWCSSKVWCCIATK